MAVPSLSDIVRAGDSAFAAGGGGITWATVTTGAALVAGAPVVVSNVTTQTMTLPASPTIGDWFAINAKGAAHRFGSNGNTIDGVGGGNDLLVNENSTAYLVAYGTNLLRVV